MGRFFVVALIFDKLDVQSAIFVDDTTKILS